MARKLLIDTDVLVDYLRGQPQAVKFLEKAVANSDLHLSAITMAELYAGVREGEERKLMEKFLQAFEVVPVDNDIARMGGVYRRDYGKSHGVGLADAIIASTVEQFEASLVTLNKKHFPMLKNVLIPYTKN